MITSIYGNRIAQGTVLEYAGASHDLYPATPGLNMQTTMEDL
jgi:hypothetical protein